MERKSRALGKSPARARPHPARALLFLPAPASPDGPGCWGWDRTGRTALTAQLEEQEQGELQQEGCPSTAPGHGLLRGFGITWSGESGFSWGSARAGDEVG